MREDYMGITTEREPIITETAEELDRLYDDVLASIEDEQKPLEE